MGTGRKIFPGILLKIAPEGKSWLGIKHANCLLWPTIPMLPQSLDTIATRSTFGPVLDRNKPVLLKSYSNNPFAGNS